MNIRFFNIGARLDLGCGVVLALLVMQSGTGLTNMSSISDALVNIVNSNAVKTAVNNAQEGWHP